MKKLFFAFFLLISFSAYSQSREVGTNVSGLQYWVPQLMFKDAFKQCSGWLTRNASSGGPWNTNATIPLRADGYPTQVPFGTTPQYVHTLLFLDAGGTHPAGTYTILSDGVGTIQLEWDCGNQSFASPCNNTFNVNPTNQGIHLIITASDLNNPVRNIRIIMPGFMNSYLSDPFYPKFMNYLDSANVFKGIRCMDLMKTNASPLKSWSERTAKEYFTQTSSTGIAYEYMIDLANRLDKDIWVCIPHQADDNFILQFATLLHDSLEAGRKIYVEYSNECWNSVFSQTSYCNAQGAALGYSGQPWEQGWKFYAKRTADCHRIFETVFGANNSRLVKVVASQAANSWLGNQYMTLYNSPTYNPAGVKADALAIAPYFGGNIADSIGNAGAISSITVSQIVASMHAAVFSQMQPFVLAYNTVASNHQVDLIAYEGGQHLVAVNNTYLNDTTLTNKLIAANRDPMMQTIYCDMLDVWFNNGGKEFFNFSSVYKPNKYGSWGVLENTEQPLISSYKWKALNSCGIVTGLSDPENLPDFELFPNPNNGQFRLSIDNKHLSNNCNVSVFNALGLIIHHVEIKEANHNINMSDQSPGIYFVCVNIGKAILTKKILVQ